MGKKRFRYIVNDFARSVHKASRLTESCNTDDIKKKRGSNSLPNGYRKCKHCFS